jgi:hypothetical protein
VKQAAFIKKYEGLLNQLPADEVVMFGDAVHPTHAVRPVGCWAPKEVRVAVEQSSGRDRLNVHGAIDLETGQTVMRDVLTVDAVSTIMLLMAIEAMYPGKRLVHLFLDNARYHHAKLVQAWLARPECRIKLHFIPAYCPHLNPIERKRTGCTVPRLRPRSLAGVVSIILAAAPFWSYRSGQANRTESPPVRAVAARSLRSSATASTRRSG